MPRLLVSLVTIGAALGASALARAESFPRPPTCDASTVLPAVTELPAGCPLATFAPIPPGSGAFEQAPPPVVFVTGANGAPVEIETSLATSWTTMPGHITYCDNYTCTDRVIDGSLQAVRYDVVFLDTPPVGATLEINGIGATRRIQVTAPGACPTVTAPAVTCELPQCGSPGAHCMQPGELCDGGVPQPQPPGRDAGPSYPRYPDARYEYPDDDHDHQHGCSATGAAAASPLLLVGLALLLRRRRR